MGAYWFWSKIIYRNDSIGVFGGIQTGGCTIRCQVFFGGDGNGINLLLDVPDLIFLDICDKYRCGLGQVFLPVAIIVPYFD